MNACIIPALCWPAHYTHTRRDKPAICEATPAELGLREAANYYPAVIHPCNWHVSLTNNVQEKDWRAAEGQIQEVSEELRALRE